MANEIIYIIGIQPGGQIMRNNRLVWTDKDGDLRNKKTKVETSVEEKKLELKIRRLTSGKGRTVIEITGLPKNKKWCEALVKDLKKAMGVGGTYKLDYIELHGEKLEVVTGLLDAKSLKWKKTGG